MSLMLHICLLARDRTEFTLASDQLQRFPADQENPILEQPALSDAFHVEDWTVLMK